MINTWHGFIGYISFIYLDRFCRLYSVEARLRLSNGFTILIVLITT